MIIIGEKLNSSIPSSLELFNNGDAEGIKALCQKQEACGADYLDINTAICENELEIMKSTVKIAMESTNCGIMIDSADISVHSEVLPEIQNRNVILNSITLDERHELIELAAKYSTGIVVLPISESGIPESTEEEIENSKQIIEKLKAHGICDEKIFLDIVIETVAVNPQAFMRAFNTAMQMRKEYPDIHLTCGLSNVSFGLPKRININSAAVSALACAGLDSAIIDITNEKIKSAVLSARVLNAVDEFCLGYIEANS